MEEFYSENNGLFSFELTFIFKVLYGNPPKKIRINFLIIHMGIFLLLDFNFEGIIFYSANIK